MAHTPTQIKHTLRLPLGVLVDDVWREVGLVEIPVTLHVDVRGGRTLAATNLSQATVVDAPEPWPTRTPASAWRAGRTSTRAKTSSWRSTATSFTTTARPPRTVW